MEIDFKMRTPSLDQLRLISLAPTPTKILECIILAVIKSKLLACYDDFQFGFRPGSSTACAKEVD